MNKTNRNGQIGLILLVLMGVVVALVMSIASRSLSDTVLSRQERESSAALSVAETGIENAMNALQNATEGQTISGNLSGLLDAEGSPTVTGNYAVSKTPSYGLFVQEGETAHLDLSGFTGTLTISWTKKTDVSEKPSTCVEGSGTAPAAIEIKAIQGALAIPTVKYAYYNPFGCALTGTNNFTASLAGTDPYLSTVQYVVPANSTILRIKPIYSGATISVTGAGLKDQLYLIQSKASGGDAQKEIEVKRGLDAPPSVFDFAVFSAGTIVK